MAKAVAKEEVRRYSQAFKRQVVEEYEAGRSAAELQQKYGVGGKMTIKRWVKEYGRAAYRAEMVHIQTVEDQLEVKALRARLAQLEGALTESVLEARMLRTTLDLASQSLQIDLKKKYASK